MKKIIDFSDVNISIDKKNILYDVNFQLYENEFVFLCGKVGCGKTSLLRSFYADIEVDGDKANVLNFDLLHIKNRNRPFLRRNIGFIFQDFKFLNDRNIINNLKFVMKATGWTDEKKINTRIEELLTEVGLENKKDTMPYSLSGGEQQRLSFVRAMLNSPPLILADEPTGNLDNQTAEFITEKLLEQTKNKTAVVFVTHDKNLIHNFKQAKNFYIENGKLIT